MGHICYVSQVIVDNNNELMVWSHRGSLVVGKFEDIYARRKSTKLNMCNHAYTEPYFVSEIHLPFRD